MGGGGRRERWKQSSEIRVWRQPAMTDNLQKTSLNPDAGSAALFDDRSWQQGLMNPRQGEGGSSPSTNDKQLEHQEEPDRNKMQKEENTDNSQQK